MIGTPPRPDTLSCVEDLLRLSHFSGHIDPNRSDPAFRNVTDIDNQRCAVDPLLVVWPRTDADVAAAIHAATKCRAPLSVISGGHGAAGYALAKDGVTMSMDAMAEVSIDDTDGILEVSMNVLMHLHQRQQGGCSCIFLGNMWQTNSVLWTVEVPAFLGSFDRFMRIRTAKLQTLMLNILVHLWGVCLVESCLSCCIDSKYEW